MLKKYKPDLIAFSLKLFLTPTREIIGTLIYKVLPNFKFRYQSRNEY